MREADQTMIAALSGLVQSLAQSYVLCVGDVMLDSFVSGNVERISPESPVPVFNAGPSHEVPGGAANVARNITALGGACTLIGVVGKDTCAAELTDLLGAQPSIKTDFVSAPDRPTTRKVRYVTQGHHMLRVDFEFPGLIPEAVEDEILSKTAAHLKTARTVVLSDYAKGVLSERVTREIILLARQAGVPLIADPKTTDLSRYAGATLVTPNAKEARLASGIDPDDDTSAIAAARACMAQTDGSAILITRSEKGMTLVHPDSEPVHIPASAREVYDVVGAGDTVIATLSAAVAAGAGLDAGARLANVAAGLVVGKRGTATISPDELLEELARMSQPARRSSPIMLTPEEAARYASARRAEGKRVGFTNGVFDIVHPGHISILEFARDNCDCLIVGLNSDASVRRLKGPTRPVNSEMDRAIVLGAFGMVDAVVIFDTDTPIELIRAIKPDVLVKGADYTIETVVGADVVQSYGGEVKLATLVPNASTTSTIARAQIGAKP